MSTSGHGASNWLRDCRGWLRQPWLWWLVALLVSLGLLGDVRHTAKYFGCDLRSRITGGRLLAAGIDPYSYFWQAGDPESFLDPEAYLAPHRPANRITVSPPVLIFCLPIASFSWTTVRWCWLVVQWCLLAAAVVLLVLATPRERRRLVLVVLLVGFVSGESWRFHVERGQAYVIYAAFGVPPPSVAAAPAGAGPVRPRAVFFWDSPSDCDRRLSRRCCRWAWRAEAG